MKYDPFHLWIPRFEVLEPEEGILVESLVQTAKLLLESYFDFRSFVLGGDSGSWTSSNDDHTASLTLTSRPRDTFVGDTPCTMYDSSCWSRTRRRSCIRRCFPGCYRCARRTTANRRKKTMVRCGNEELEERCRARFWFDFRIVKDEILRHVDKILLAMSSFSNWSIVSRTLEAKNLVSPFQLYLYRRYYSFYHYRIYITICNNIFRRSQDLSSF